MGSTNHANIPVVNKFTTNDSTLRKDSRKIKATSANNDQVSVVLTDSVVRPIGSGSTIIDGTVTYTEDVVVGMSMPGRNVPERIASRVGAPRSLSVDLAGNTTQAVIPSGLEPDVPQRWAFKLGDKVVRQNSASDNLTDRI